MSGDSTVAGPLSPISGPIWDDAYDDVLHDFVMGLAGLDTNLVRPRWQPEPPNQPDFNINWAAFGITDTLPDVHSFEGIDPLDPSRSIVQRDEVLTVLCSFYGPNSMSLAKQFQAGAQISQNRAVLQGVSTTVIECTGPVQIPALMKMIWVKRCDATLLLRRRATWIYDIRTLLSIAGSGLDNELYVTPINVPAP